MKKIMVVFNGIHTPTHVLQFAINAATQNQYSIQGIFLDDEPSSNQGYPFPNDLYLTEEKVTSETIAEENEKILAGNIRFLEDECAIAGVPCSVEKKISFKSLIDHTSTADLLALDTKADFERFKLTNILTDAHCPVCLVAITAPEVEYIIFAFDGSERSRYAIRKFAELFPNVPAAKTYLVSVNAGMEGVEHKEFINGWLAKHFQNLNIKQLEGDEREVFIDFIRQYPDNALVVMGAFGRSALSRMFHPSLANNVLSDTRLSLFVAHK